MISLKKICVEFGSESLLDDVSFLIGKNDKIGLVGRNGAGKTTLMRLLMKHQLPSDGVIEMPKDIQLAYLPQEKRFTDDKTVFAEAMLAFSEILKLRTALTDVQDKIEHADKFNENELFAFYEHFNDMHERYALLGGDEIEMKTEKVLLGLGFEKEDFVKPLSTFSEGWQMRVELAKILLIPSDILLLDEPTNHLDIESIQWLEQYLIAYQGAILLVSHDKMFLNSVTSRTIEIIYGKIYDYPVSYTKYVELRDERIESQKREYSSQQKEIEQIEKFISRFRYKATKAKQVQSRIKQLNKMETIRVEELDTSEISFRFPDCPHSGKLVIEAVDVSKSYATKKVIEKLSFTVTRGQKIAFVGKNGQGKTTLSKIIVGETDYTGQFKLGHNVKLGYYAQDFSKLFDYNKTVQETAEYFAHADYFSRVRTVLGNFLFAGDDVLKKVSVLSGGEKSRLMLACLMCQPTNMLVLDEPTNHLDMLSKEVLKYALMSYQGTIIIVSHDREFLQGLTDTVFYFVNHTIKQYPGTFDEFLHLKNIHDVKELERTTQKSSGTGTVRQSMSENKIQWEQKKNQEREARKIANTIQKTELDIHKCESEIAEIEQKLNEAHLDFSEDSYKSLLEEHSQKKEYLNELLLQWEDLHTKLEQF